MSPDVHYRSLAEVSTQLNVSSRTLCMWAKKGTLPGAIRIGRAWRVKAQDFDAWLARKHQDAVASVPTRSWQWPHSTPGSTENPSTASEQNHGGPKLASEIDEMLRKRLARRKR